MKVSERLQTAVFISARFAPKFIFVRKMESETFLLFNQKTITLYKENKNYDSWYFICTAELSRRD